MQWPPSATRTRGQENPTVAATTPSLPTTSVRDSASSAFAPFSRPCAMSPKSLIIMHVALAMGNQLFSTSCLFTLGTFISLGKKRDDLRNLWTTSESTSLGGTMVAPNAHLAPKPTRIGRNGGVFCMYSFLLPSLNIT